MTPDRDPAVQAWIDEARAVPLLAAASVGAPGIKLRKAGAEYMAACPVCGGKDRDEFALNESAGGWLCRKSGAKGRDAIGLVSHIANVEFLAAVEMLTGKPKPGKPLTDEERAAAESRRQQREDAARRDREKREREAAEARRRREEDALALWEATRPIEGTHAAAYLKARGLTPHPSWTFDLRFAMAPWWHDGRDLGDWPCMVAAFRQAGRIIGVHRTYLDPKEPRKATPPVDGTKPKKMLGSTLGGLIMLSDWRSRMAIGEGIETTRSAWCLGVVPEDFGLAAAGSLGNIAGGATGTREHPTKTQPNGKPVHIPNGEPDMDRPGFVIPADAGVETIALLMDRDSDPPTTRQHLLVAARRLRVLEIETMFVRPRPGSDFNDDLREAA